MTSSSLSLELQVEQGLRGQAHLMNSGNTALRVFRTGSSWGDEALTFEAQVDGRPIRIEPQPQVYTRNVPATEEILPGGRYSIAFNLTDEEWSADVDLDAIAISGVVLTAVYEVAESDEASAGGTWTGRVRSDPVVVP